jgi:hypothetical protein
MITLGINIAVAVLGYCLIVAWGCSVADRFSSNSRRAWIAVTSPLL